MKLVYSILCTILFALTSLSQPLNKKTVYKNCEDYILNPKKVKLWWANPDRITVGLEKVTIDIDPISLPPIFCDDRINIVSNTIPVNELIKNAIVASYPIRKKRNLWINITDIRILKNLLPTPNPRLYVGMQFFMKDDNGNYNLILTYTQIGVVAKYIEKSIITVIKKSIYDFNLNYPFDIISKNEGLPTSHYLSYKEFKDNNPSFSSHFLIKEKKDNGLVHTYQAIDSTLKKQNSFFFIKNNNDSYVNASFYYPKNHLLKLYDVTNDFYLIYDQIYDYTKANTNTVIFGGGLIGALASSASASKKSVGLINKKTGELICYTHKKIKTILSEDTALLNEYFQKVKNDDIDAIATFFRGLLSNKLYSEIFNE
ncbi:MAG: DUF6563 family protein [Cyclobacteriaceae bacterium]